MRYFIHIVTELERIRDIEGAMFQSLSEARTEASQSARDLMAEELRAGRPLPLDWRLQIVDEEESVVFTLNFSALVYGRADRARPLSAAARMALFERAKSTFARTRAAHVEIVHGLGELRDQVRKLAEYSTALGGR